VQAYDEYYNYPITKVTETEYTFVMPASDVTVSLDFYTEDEIYNITIAECENGTVALRDGLTGHRESLWVYLNIDPDEGYVLDEVNVVEENGESIEWDSDWNGFIMPASDVTVTVTFVSTEGTYAIEILSVANGTVTAQEGVYDQYCGEDQHSHIFRNFKNGGEYSSTCHEAGSYVDGEEYQKYHRTDNLQNRGFGGKTVGQILGQGNGIVRSCRETTQTLGDQYPVQNSTDTETDADPCLAETECEDTAWQPHQQPCTHIGSLGAHSGNPGTHLTSAEEVALFTAVLVLDKEPNADAKHKRKINDKHYNFCIHSFFSIRLIV
jgi:hypothetical protein